MNIMTECTQGVGQKIMGVMCPAVVLVCLALLISPGQVRAT